MMDYVLENVFSAASTVLLGYIGFQVRTFSRRIRELEQMVKNGLKSKVEDLHEQVYNE